MGLPGPFPLPLHLLNPFVGWLMEKALLKTTPHHTVWAPLPTVTGTLGSIRSSCIFES